MVVQTELELLIPQAWMMQSTAGRCEMFPVIMLTDMLSFRFGALGEGVWKVEVVEVADGNCRDVGEGVGLVLLEEKMLRNAVDNAANMEDNQK